VKKTVLRIKQCYTKSWIKVLDEATRQTYGLLVQDKRTTTTTTEEEEEEEEEEGGGQGGGGFNNRNKERMRRKRGKKQALTRSQVQILGG
jgi:hypothetical protein